MMVRQCDECNNLIEADADYYKIQIEHMAKNGIKMQCKQMVKLDLCSLCTRKRVSIVASVFEHIPAQIDSHLTRLGCAGCGAGPDGPHTVGCAMSHVVPLGPES